VEIIIDKIHYLLFSIVDDIRESLSQLSTLEPTMLNFQSLLTARNLRLGIFIVPLCLLSFGYYLQYFEGLEPCALCITQRFFLFTCSCLGLIALLHKPALLGARIYALIGIAISLAGAGIASRQLYLQSLPADQAPACGPSLDFIFQTFPLTDALSILLRGDGNCAEVVWRFLGLSIPGWTVIIFIGLAVSWLLQSRINKAV
jgi:disulfide bond formation protein DsbB